MDNIINNILLLYHVTTVHWFHVIVGLHSKRSQKMIPDDVKMW